MPFSGCTHTKQQERTHLSNKLTYYDTPGVCMTLNVSDTHKHTVYCFKVKYFQVTI
uniref:Uncharacterized protein n=1 Tax=Arion vulgaris TaxID=1028688 RepID=A0A0B7AN26_9EUPU